MSWENHLKIQENKISGKLIPWMIMSMEKCLPGGKNGRIEYLEEKIREINVVQPYMSFRISLAISREHWKQDFEHPCTESMLKSSRVWHDFQTYQAFLNSSYTPRRPQNLGKYLHFL